MRDRVAYRSAGRKADIVAPGALIYHPSRPLPLKAKSWMTIQDITLYLAKFPLTTPYKVSYRVYEDFDPILVEMRGTDGRVGWGEGHISPGYSDETVEGGWKFCRAQAEALLGQDTGAAKRTLLAATPASPVAASALISALEMLEGNPILAVDAETRLPLLEPVHGEHLADIPAEIETLLGLGFKTLKLKVGWDVDENLARVAAVQKALDGRGDIRLDANRAFSRADGCRFAAAIDGAGDAGRVDLQRSGYRPCGRDRQHRLCQAEAQETGQHRPPEGSARAHPRPRHAAGPG
jgi:O-succinylbenzoate synthase